jgi:hypothetical protein
MRMKILVCSFLLALAMTVPSSAGIIFSIGIAPPPLPVYVQPVCPGDGYIWTPGYWAYSDDGGYFWVPGTWVLVPEPGLLWTPGWWGWDGGFFVFHEGYWGTLVGFYGGIDYGFGYGGFGYDGGYWRNGAFFYNRSVNNVVNVTNVYNKTLVVNTTVRNVSYNGGSGGTTARPTAQEEAAARERHISPVAAQRDHVERASTNRQLFESTNHGRPPVAATARPGAFSGREVVRAMSAGPSYRPPTERSVARSGSPNRGGTPSTNTNAIRPRELPSPQRSAPSTGNAKADRKYQQEQQKLAARQEQERQSLQRKQDQEHQRLEQHRASAAEQQRVEQRHQQQTQQLQQKHAQEQQRVQEKRSRP